MMASGPIAEGIALGAKIALAVYALMLVLVLRTRRTEAWSRTKAIGAVTGIVAAAAVYVARYQLAEFVIKNVV